jgi:hypothetical protein
MAFTWAEEISAVRRELAAACQELTSPSPQGLDRSAARLEAAAVRLTACHEYVPDFTNASLSEARRLQIALRHAQRLLDTAREFHEGWAARLGAWSGGYTNAGRPAPIKCFGHLQLQG